MMHCAIYSTLPQKHQRVNLSDVNILLHFVIKTDKYYDMIPTLRKITFHCINSSLKILKFYSVDMTFIYNSELTV